MTPTEIARGYLVGSEGTLPEPSDNRSTPREALERLLAVALARPPCGVAFSGGRDSSFVLAVAAHVARRRGLPEPIPITRRFPGLEEADETEWQEAVVRHLGLQDWQRIDFTDELDIVGPVAQRHLLEHGVLWPAALATNVPLIDAVAGGSLVDGEGGDEVLGDEAHRIGAVNQLVRGGRARLRRRAVTAAAEVAPRFVRRRLVQSERAAWPWGWLRGEARADFIAELARDRVERPLSWAASVRAMPLRRTQLMGTHNRRTLARMSGVDLCSPLIQPDFVHALARHGGFRGRGGRTEVLRRLASDLLPDAVLARPSKAFFNRAYISNHSRRFAETWDGSGVDPEIVDEEGLRATWLGAHPHWMSATLLQQAWLASVPTSRPDDRRVEVPRVQHP